MKTTKDNISKRNYCQPSFERILLDKEIALVLESDPPLGPEETYNDLRPEYFNSDHNATNCV